MKLITWAPVLLSSKRFPEENGKKFLPGREVKEAIKDALVYYALKKDKELDNKVKKFIRMHRKSSLRELIRNVEKMVLEKEKELLESIKIPEKVFLEGSQIKEKPLEVYDLKRWDFKDVFKSEVFEGVVELNIEGDIEKIKPACHSYCEALAHAELTFVREHPIGEIFHRNLLSEMKNWEIPLRIGFWTTAPFGGRLFWFWGDKEIRNKIRRLYRIDLRPRKVIYLPLDKKTAGWTEVKKDA